MGNNKAARLFGEYHGSRRASAFCLLPFLLLLSATPARARQVASPFKGSLLPTARQSAPQSAPDEEEIKPSRPGVASPAEIQKPGVLQLEFGYDANHRAEEFRTEQTVPLTLRFAASKRLLLEADFEALKSETDEETRVRMTGVGDTRLGFQLVALEDTEEHPALGFAYFVKLPTASEAKGLGTGRFDHKFVTLLSKKFGQTDVDFNAALLAVGREGAPGWVRGGQAALSFSREFDNDFGLEGELSGQTKEDVQPKGLFALGALTFKANPRLRLDAGLRFGLNPEAPRVGVFGGVTVGVADFFKK